MLQVPEHVPEQAPPHVLEPVTAAPSSSESARRVCGEAMDSMLSTTARRPGILLSRESAAGERTIFRVPLFFWQVVLVQFVQVQLTQVQLPEPQAASAVTVLPLVPEQEAWSGAPSQSTRERTINVIAQPLNRLFITSSRLVPLCVSVERGKLNGILLSRDRALRNSRILKELLRHLGM